MSMPLKTLLDFDGNSYEIVAAVIKRSQQLTDIRVAYNPTTLEEETGTTAVPELFQLPPEEKVVTVAFQEIFNDSVSYKMKTD